MRWSYGVTTVPSRKDGLLPQTLDSLKTAGFESPRLFVDGCSNADAEVWYWQRFNLQVTCHHPAVRAVGNWALALGELYIREPKADHYAIFQDDLLASKNLRQYLETWYPHNSGYLNLYTTPSNQHHLEGKGIAEGTKVGWHESFSVSTDPKWQSGRGALGLVFDREAVVKLLGAESFLRKPQAKDGFRSIDGAVVTALNGAGYREYIHNPSLLQHTGSVSTIDKRKGKNVGAPGNYPPWVWAKKDYARSFRGVDFDCMTLCSETR